MLMFCNRTVVFAREVVTEETLAGPLRTEFFPSVARHPSPPSRAWTTLFPDWRR